MMRNASRHLPHRVLHRMPTGALVRLLDGSVWGKFCTKWMPAGWVIPDPLRPSDLVGLNGGRMPETLLPASTLGVAT